MEPVAEPDRSVTATDPRPPRWMRRSTLLLLIVLAILALGLVLYFLLPAGWARVVGSMTHGTAASWHGVGFGIVFTLAAVATAALALRSRHRPERRGLVIGLVVATAVLAAPNLLTLLIATGLTAPLARADVVLRITAPGFTVGTLVGVVVAALLAAGGRYLWVNRGRSEASTDGA
ncbi:hypothetical protein GCG21_06895 [Pseudactinotalea sp. HY160]|uniref:hypothetical protein n=1 Tax=Pseudactinotalea sp. HY160 TaxID=2654490 RepID=UPI00128CF06F|nr:hypothetical protein [Pseudactinotalea sp. HY160]MPV49736.1 hypothetical protein [Pseudactinotalea sp. HY160]